MRKVLPKRVHHIFMAATKFGSNVQLLHRQLISCIMTSTSDASVSSQKYVIGTNRHANSRLNLQYYLGLRQFNNDLLDPLIVNSLSNGLKTPNLRIADVCCGTGFWLIDLQRVVDPSTRLYGFDINLGNLPPAAWIPRIETHPYNIFDSPSVDFQGTFDIINVSLTLTFVNDEAINSTMANVLTLLKPGGWLQWTEADPIKSEIYTPDPTIETKYMQQVVTGAWEFMGLSNPTWVAKLDSVFKSNSSFEPGSVSATRPEPDLAIVRAWTEMLGFMGAEEMFAGFSLLHPQRNTAQGQEKIDRYREIVEGAYREYKEHGAGFWTQYIRVVGRKKKVDESDIHRSDV